MATQAGGFIRDQNLNVHFDVAVAPSVLKTNNKLQKNGGLGGRKALGDISNSRRPSTNLPPNKLSSKKAIPVAEDFVPSIPKSSIGVKKTKLSTKGSGRKALGDLTNSITPHVVQGPKKALEKKLSAVVEEPLLFDSEGIDEYFLHDHEECVKAQKKANAMDLEYFLKDYGVGNSMQSSPPLWVPPHSSAKMKPESPIEFSDLEEMFGESKFDKNETLGEENICESPISLPRYQGDFIFSLKSSP